MRYFFDTEFIESGPDHPIVLISIGIVSEDNNKKIKKYYAVSSEFNPNEASEWVKKHVISNLRIPKEGAKTREEIKNDIIKFIGNDKNPQFWADHCAYDWVIFCQLFGGMVDLPKNFPQYCNDIKIEEMRIDNIKMPKQKGTKHDALDGAKYIYRKYKFLNKYYFTGNELNLKDLKKAISKKMNKKIIYKFL